MKLKILGITFFYNKAKGTSHHGAFIVYAFKRILFMRTWAPKLYFALVLLLSACGGKGGSGGGASSPLVGSWIEQFPNPANNIYAGITQSSFTVQQGTCTISGGYTLDSNIIHAFSVTRSPACLAGNSSFDCTYSMSSNNQLSLSCPAFSTNLQRN